MFWQFASIRPLPELCTRSIIETFPEHEICFIREWHSIWKTIHKKFWQFCPPVIKKSQFHIYFGNSIKYVLIGFLLLLNRFFIKRSSCWLRSALCKLFASFEYCCYLSVIKCMQKLENFLQIFQWIFVDNFYLRLFYDFLETFSSFFDKIDKKYWTWDIELDEN